MEFLSMVKSALGRKFMPETQTCPGKEILLLVERIRSCTQLHEVRDACRALHSLSQRYRLQVGTAGLTTLAEKLIKPRFQDQETTSCILYTLCNITSPRVLEGEELDAKHEVGKVFTDMLLKMSETVSAVIYLLDRPDTHIKLPAVKLLKNLCDNKPEELKQRTLACQMGLAKLMNVLSNSQDVVRNEVLLLLVYLTESDVSIQGFLVFDSGFEKRFAIIQAEGNSDGGIVVDDCIKLLLNLLKGNSSNKLMLLEENCIKNIIPFLKSTSARTWPIPKIINMHSMLQVVRTLVSPTNEVQTIAHAQKVLSSCGVLAELCVLMMTSGVPPSICTELMFALGDCIRGCFPNQRYFQQLTWSFPDIEPCSALAVLLMTMLDEKQPTSLRSAISYCFECFLQDNTSHQLKIIDTLLPTSDEDVFLSYASPPGLFLWNGISSTNHLTYWFSILSLSRAIFNNSYTKELLLLVGMRMETGIVIPLLQEIVNRVQLGGHTQTRLANLMLLSTWLTDCPMAVSQFLNMPDMISFLTAQVVSEIHEEGGVLVQSLCALLLGVCLTFYQHESGSNVSINIKEIIKQNIGVERFFKILTEFSLDEMFTETIEQLETGKTEYPQIMDVDFPKILFDRQFCLLYKNLLGSVAEAMERPEAVAVEPSVPSTMEPSETDSDLEDVFYDVLTFD